MLDVETEAQKVDEDGQYGDIEKRLWDQPKWIWMRCVI